MDNKVSTMYSSGSPENHSESAHPKAEYLEKLMKAKSNVKPNSVSQSILSAAESSKLVVGNWHLFCKIELNNCTLCVQNVEGQSQSTYLKDDMSGFVFESNRGSKHLFIAENPIQEDIAVGWNITKKATTFRSKLEEFKLGVYAFAREVYDEHLKEAESLQRGAMAQLITIVDKMDILCLEVNDKVGILHSKNFTL